MRRARACFQKEGIRVDYYSTNKVVLGKNSDFAFYLLPSTISMNQWESLIHEILGYLIYKVVGYA